MAHVRVTSTKSLPPVAITACATHSPPLLSRPISIPSQTHSPCCKHPGQPLPLTHSTQNEHRYSTKYFLFNIFGAFFFDANCGTLCPWIRQHAIALHIRRRLLKKTRTRTHLVAILLRSHRMRHPAHVWYRLERVRVSSTVVEERVRDSFQFMQGDRGCVLVDPFDTCLCWRPRDWSVGLGVGLGTE